MSRSRRIARAVGRVHRRQETLTDAYCSPPPADRCHTLAASSAARASSVRPSARRTRPRCTARARPGGRRRSPRPSRSRAASVRAPASSSPAWHCGAAEARQLVRLGLEEPELARLLGRPFEVRDGVVEAVLEAAPARRGSPHHARATTDRRRRPASRPRSRAATLRSRSPAEMAARAAKSQFAAWSHGRSRSA